jgi:hypothetical protein
VTITVKKWLFFSGLALVIAYDVLIGIPDHVLFSFLLAALFLAIGDLNKRLEKVERGDAPAKRLDGLK